jgi:uncharacterized protein (PEP-CTERM system associated)
MAPPAASGPAAPAATSAPNTAASSSGPAALNARLAGIGFRVVPSFEIGETYNDNVNLAAKGHETWDLITALTPGLDATEDASHFRGRLVYDPQALLFARGTSSPVLQQRLLGTGHATLYRDMLFFDTTASIQQAYLSSTGAIGPTTLTTNNNLQTVQTVNASPSLVEHLGRFADSQTLYRFSYIDTSGNQIAPEQIHNASQKFTGGEFFGRLGWGVTGSWTQIDRLQGTNDPFGGTSSTDELGRLDLQYPIFYSISVIGGAGYERIVDPTLLTQPNGPIWNVGLQYQPNDRLSASLTYGRRFEETDIEFHASYALTQQLHVLATYTQQVQTSQSLLASNLNQVTLGPNGTFVNAQTGLPVSANGTTLGTTNTDFGITSGSFLDKRYELDVEATRGRNTYTFAGYNEKHTGNTFATANERITGTTLSWMRQLWPNLSSTVSGAYSRSLFQDGSGRVDDLYSVSLNLAYTVSATATANLSATRYDRMSNQAVNSLVDDVVTVSLHKQF